MLITSERAYHNVVSIAELAPDDYLIKPFTADELHGRLVRALYRKQFFAAALRASRQRRLQRGALKACQRLLAQESGFLFDLLRFKGEILNVLGRPAEAQAVFEQVLQQRVVPWARMGLATALRSQQRLRRRRNRRPGADRRFPGVHGRLRLSSPKYVKRWASCARPRKPCNLQR
jgi:hypothetical protein